MLLEVPSSFNRLIGASSFAAFNLAGSSRELPTTNIKRKCWPNKTFSSPDGSRPTKQGVRQLLPLISFRSDNFSAASRQIRYTLGPNDLCSVASERTIIFRGPCVVYQHFIQIHQPASNRPQFKTSLHIEIHWIMYYLVSRSILCGISSLFKNRSFFICITPIYSSV